MTGISRGTFNPLLAAVIACGALAAMPSTARACWDGASVNTGRVQIATGSFGPRWSPAMARQVALWAARIEATLPEDGSVVVDHGFVEVCGVDTDTQHGCMAAQNPWNEQSLGELFVIVADLVGADWRTRVRARRVMHRPLTVQLAASTDRRVASAIARRAQLHMHDEQLHAAGVLEVGGFPAVNDFIYVARSRNASGQRIYTVVAGTFMDRADARSALAMARRATGLNGFVRRL